MKNTIENIKTTIETKSAERAEILKKSQADLKKAGETLTALNAQLEQAQDLDEYERIKAKIKEAENTLDFCNKRVAQAKGVIISDAEYREMQQQLDAEVDKIKVKHAPKVQKAIADLVAAMDAYTAEANEIEDIREKAHSLNTKGANLGIGGSYYKTYEMTSFNIDPLEWQPGILQAYFNHKTVVVAATSNPEKILKDRVFSSPETIRIAQAYINGRR